VRELSTQLTEQALREVEAQQRPRTLTVDQQRMLIQQLREGPKGQFEIMVAISDSEADRFARQFDLVLKDAGWTRKKSGFGSTYLDEDYPTQLLVGLMIDVSGHRQGFESKTHRCVVQAYCRTLRPFSSYGHEPCMVHTPHFPSTA
jgi:hypothetical protein